MRWEWFVRFIWKKKNFSIVVIFMLVHLALGTNEPEPFLCETQTNRHTHGDARFSHFWAKHNIFYKQNHHCMKGTILFRWNINNIHRMERAPESKNRSSFCIRILCECVCVWTGSFIFGRRCFYAHPNENTKKSLFHIFCTWMIALIR